MRLMSDLEGTDATEAQQCDIKTGCMDLILDRLTNAWKLHQKVCYVTCTLLLADALRLHKESSW